MMLPFEYEWGPRTLNKMWNLCF